jgi:hypothetical protein
MLYTVEILGVSDFAQITFNKRTQSCVHFKKELKAFFNQYFKLCSPWKIFDVKFKKCLDIGDPRRQNSQREEGECDQTFPKLDDA